MDGDTVGKEVGDLVGAVGTNVGKSMGGGAVGE